MVGVEAIKTRSGEAGFVDNLLHRVSRQFELQAADWLDTCRQLPHWEDRHLIEASPSADLSEHAALLDALEKVGQWLEATARELSFESSPLLRQIESALQDLHDSRAMWHGETAPAKKRQILRDCFNEP